MRRAIVLGGTGLVGQSTLHTLLGHPKVSQVQVLTRRKFSTQHSKLIQVVTDFRDPHKLPIEGDDLYCALGTTLKKAGSREAFRAIDFELALAVAERARAQGVERMGLVSALGASTSSPFFYSRVKGELEAALGELGFESLTILRPGLLVGPRLEHRRGELWARWWLETLGPLVPRRYQPIASRLVGWALAERVLNVEEPGLAVLESEEIQDLFDKLLST